MTIDSHQHFWKYDASRHAWITDEMNVLKRDFLPDELSVLLKQHGMDGCVVVQADQTEDENEFLLSLAGQHDFIKGVVGWVDLRVAGLEERLYYFTKHTKLKGFRHIVQSEPSGFLDDRKFVEGVRRLSQFGFTYDLLIYHHQLPEALRFLSQVENVNIAIDHLAKPAVRSGEIIEWKKHISVAASFQNVFCKVSGMVTEANWQHWKQEDFQSYLDHIFEVFGPARVMYGSDWPVCLLAASYAQQFEIVSKYVSQLSPSEKKCVMGENAKRFYNL